MPGPWNFRKWRERGWLRTGPGRYQYYMRRRWRAARSTRSGHVFATSSDHLGAIKKHELTRTEKEEDRMIHVRNQQANIEPVFFAYPDNAEIDAIVEGGWKSGLSTTSRPRTASAQALH